MPRQLDLSMLEPMLDDRERFELTPAEYERIVGRALPKTDDYFIKRSKVAKVAKEKGYRIRIEYREIIQRTIIFEKRERK